jgi:hypothetical protein
MNVVAARNFEDASVNAPEAIQFAVTGCDLGKVLVARSRTGVCAILLGTNAEELEIELGKIFPDEVFVRDECAVKEDIQDPAFSVFSERRTRYCSRYPRHVLPAQGLGGPPHHSGGSAAHLRAVGLSHSGFQVAPGDRSGLRRQSDRPRYSLPSRDG